jgi:large subunit ribosomal protein L18
MKATQKKTETRNRRHKRIRAKVKGTIERPRLSVFKSNKYLYAQIINDDKGETLAAASTKDVKGKGLVEKAKLTGAAIAKLAIAKNITQVVFDRGGFIYTGRVRALADGAREGGLKF